jgi:two-component sensor histidine kinase
LSVPSDSDTPIIEPNPSGDSPDTGMRALQLRIRQQELLAELGVIALQGASFDELLNETARLAATGLDVEFCKVLEHIPASNRLLVRAGVGWNANIVGIASVGADLESPAGFALRTGAPVISNHLENEERFRTSELMEQHGIRRAMNVILQGEGKPFGVLEVDSCSDDEFLEHDLAFLQGAANILGMAIERERHHQQLSAALEKHQFLLKEMNHRVKNSLAIVASLLNLQAREIGSPELTGYLNEAANRISAIGKAHDQLSYGSHIERMDLGRYIKAICKDLDESVANCEVITRAADGILVPTDRAISIALLVNELIANAAKHAYKNETGGKIWIKVDRDARGTLVITVRDDGAGLPPDFDISKAKGLGMRIVTSFAKQLSATLAVHSREPGTEFVLSMPPIIES